MVSGSSKKILREEALARRGMIAPDVRERACHAILHRFLEDVPLRHDSVIAGYWPVRGEVDVRPLLAELIRRGHRAALPQVVEAKTPLAFRLWHEGAAMVEGRYGIHEPDPAACASVVPHVILTPLLAFDARGHRLGYGSGFYDRTFAALQGRHAFLAVGVAFDAQKLDAVPAGPYDHPMNMILTEKKTYAFQGSGI